MATENVFSLELTTVRLTPFIAIDPFSIVRLSDLSYSKSKYQLPFSSNFFYKLQFDQHDLEPCVHLVYRLVS